MAPQAPTKGFSRPSPETAVLNFGGWSQKVRVQFYQHNYFKHRWQVYYQNQNVLSLLGALYLCTGSVLWVFFFYNLTLRVSGRSFPTWLRSWAKLLIYRMVLLVKGYQWNQKLEQQHLLEWMSFSSRLGSSKGKRNMYWRYIFNPWTSN